MADLEGEAVLLNIQSGRYFGLNEVGTSIWSLIKEPQ
ncbi:MAG: PqqD family protein, partial [Rhodothermales bacterium]